MKEKLVSVIVPCYNMANKIERLMNSLINQTYSNLEIIFINDGSLDNTEIVLEKYKQSLLDKGYEVLIITQENQGLGAAINAGLALFKGEYFCWPDADDYLEADSIKLRVEILEQNPEIAVVSSDAYLRKSESIENINGKLSDFYPESSEKKQFYLLLDEKSFFCPGCHMVRTKMFFDVNPQRVIYPARRGQNWQLLLPLYYKYPRKYLDIPLYNYIDYTDSMSKNADDLDDLTRRYKEHYLILIKTLKMIEEVQNANLQKEIRRVEIKTTRNIYMAAIKYGNVNLAKENFQKLKKMQVLKMQDRIKYFMVKHYYLRVLLNKMIWRKK